MIVKTITYDSVDGKETFTEDFYFNLNKIEVIALQIKDKRGLLAVLEAMSENNDAAAAYDWIQEIVLLAHGRKSADGKGFTKTEELNLSFKQSEAFVNMVFELLENAATTGAQFFNELISEKMRQEIIEANEKIKANLPTETPELPAAVAPSKKSTDYTRDELLAMSEREFEALVGSDIRKMSSQELAIAMQRKS